MGFLRVGGLFKKIFRSTHMAEKNLFSIVSFNSYFYFWRLGPEMGCFGGWDQVQKLFGGSTFDFDLVLGLF